MKLWVLERSDTGYDEALGFVVRAESELEARTLAGEQAGFEGSTAWHNPQDTTCEELSEDGPAEVILRDFLRG